MNRVNILTACDMLQFCARVNKVMLEKGIAITGKPFTEEEITTLQSECIAAEEAIQLLEQAVREDIDYETYCKQNVDASNSKVLVPADLFDNGIVDY